MQKNNDEISKKMARVLSIDIGKGNYALCAVSLPEVHVQRLECWRLGETKATPASQLIDRLLDHFKDWDLWSTGWSPDVVLIEQQVRGAHINLALAFATYAHMKTRFPRATVRFVKPASKFKAFSKIVSLTDQVLCARVQNMASLTYAKRKRLAVDIAEAILREKKQPDLTLHCPGTKKDDLADAFLQSFCN